MESWNDERRKHIVLQRRRLISALGGLTSRKLALITAPGGYGKTVLMQAFTAQLTATAVCWLTLDPADASLPVLLRQLVRKVSASIPQGYSLALPAEQAPTDISNIRALGRLFATELEQHIEEHLLLVFDNFHTVTWSHEVIAFFDAFLQYLPRSVHVLMAARERPNIALGRLQVRDEVVMLTLQDLACTKDEIQQLFTECLELHLSDELLAFLQDQTEGWIMALMLLGRPMCATSQDQWHMVLDRSLRTGALSAFLIEEVLGQQPHNVQDFLLDTAMLSRLQPAVIERALGYTGAGAILQEMEARGLFVVPLQEPEFGYRYHKIFMSFLYIQSLNKRGEQEVARLHTCIGQAYEGIGNVAASLEHYVAARDFTKLASLMVDWIDANPQAFHQDVAQSWVQRIPAEIQDRNPDVMYVRAHLAYCHAYYDALPMLYQRCLEQYGAQQDEKGIIRTLSKIARYIWKTQPLPMFTALDRWVASPMRDIHLYAYMVQTLARTYRGGWMQAILDLELLLKEIAPATSAYFSCLENLVYLSFWASDGQRTRTYGTALLTERLAMGELSWEMYQWVSLYWQGDAAGLEAYHRQFMALEVPVGFEHAQQMIGLFGQGLIHLCRGERQRALTCFKSLQPYFYDRRAPAQTMGREATFFVQMEMARIYARDGLAEEALSCLQRNLEISVEHRETCVMAHAAMAELLVQIDDIKGARDYLTRATHMSQAGVDGPSTIALGLAACKVAAAEGDMQSVRRSTAKVLEVVRAKRCPWYLFYIGGPEILPLLLDYTRNPLAGGLPGQLVFEVIRGMGAQVEQELTLLMKHQNPAIRAATATILDHLYRAEGHKKAPRLRVYSLSEEFCVYHHDMLLKSSEWNRTKVKLLFLFLLMRRGKQLFKESLTNLLWPGASASAARNSLRATIHGLKHSLEPDLIAGTDSTFVHSDKDAVWMSSVDEVWFDLWEFEELISRAKVADKAGRRAEAIRLYRAGCDMSHGFFLPGVAFADYFQEERYRTEHAYLGACLRVARACIEDGAVAEAIDYAQRVVRQDRAAEEGYQILIRAYLSSGQYEKAEQAYKVCRKYMRLDLGTEPSDETKSLLKR